MKSTFLFCTKLRMFLSEIPLLVLLIAAIIYTDKVKGLLGLWPLIIIVAAFMIFIVLFFFRFISISYEEIRIFGLFSSKDSREINEGKTVKLVIRNRRYLSVELWGIDKRPEFNWISEKEENDTESCLFRERAVGGEGAVKRVLSYFSVPKEDFKDIFTEEHFEKAYGQVAVYSSIVNEKRQVSVKILTTL